MPGSVKTEKDEAAWSKAKEAAKDSYPDIDTDSDRYWAIVQTIYGKMKDGSSSHAEKAFPRLSRLLGRKSPGAQPSTPHPAEHQGEALRQYHEHVQASFHSGVQPLHPHAFGVHPHPAVEQYHAHVQASFHAGQRPLHPSGFGVPHSEHLGKAQRSPRLVLLLSKAYVHAHTRRLPSGRTVTIAPYFTKRVAAQKEGSRERKRKPSDRPVPRGVYAHLHPEHLSARLVRHVEEGTMSHAEAHANLDHLERRATAGHHLEHGHGPSWTPEETHAFVKHARGKLYEHQQRQEEKQKAEEERVKERIKERETAKKRQRALAREKPDYEGVQRLLTWEHAQHWHPFVADYAVLLTRTQAQRDAVDGYQVKKTPAGYEIYYGGQSAFKPMSADTLYDWMGRTPLVRLQREADDLRADIHAQHQKEQTQAQQQAQAKRIEELTGKGEERQTEQTKNRVRVGTRLLVRGSKDFEHVVEDALKQGKPVPPEVLADYPDLKARKPRRPRGSRHRAQVEELLQQRRALGKSRLVLLLRRAS